MSSTPTLHGKAVDDLAYIRETMDRSRQFTAVSGWGGVGMAGVALTTAPLAHGRDDPQDWLIAWIVAAGIGLLIGVVSISVKARDAGVPLSRGAGLRFTLGLGPPLFVGGLLTIALFTAQVPELLPGMWLLVFGTALTTAGAYSIPLIPLMGAGFLALGVGALFSPAAWGDHYMAAGFGGINLLGGLIVMRRHGG